MKGWVLLLGFVIACGEHGPRDSSIDRIWGQDDFRPVLDDDIKAKAIGTMTNCTVSHLGNGYALTAGHCFGQVAFSGIQRTGSCRSSRYSVRWGRTYTNPHGYLISRCESIVMREYNADRDYAVFKMSPPYPTHELRPKLDLRGISGSQITVYSYPAGRPLEMSGYCRVLDYRDEGPFFYFCDTDSGSSGGPVFNFSGEIVGIHGWDFKDRNGGTLVKSTDLDILYDGESLMPSWSQ